MSIATEDVWVALHEPLRAFLRRRLPDDESVDDLLQEVFLRIHQHRERLRTCQKLERWAYRIAHHLVCDYYRRRRAFVPLEQGTEAGSLAPSAEAEQECEAARAAIKRSLPILISRLPVAYQEALVLTEYEGLSQRELAQRLGLSFSGAKSRVQRARERLRQLLQACCRFEFDRLGRVIGYRPLAPCCVAPEASQQCSVPPSCPAMLPSSPLSGR
ncbi:RNA polymerase sigma factor SigZ [Thermogemmatispora sp.]|uniref:RNA polymerase sigma factor SigZ n=1 Tax=Thermogemmatispora sp. TaxID=1968838 RepID=UPI0035E419EE